MALNILTVVTNSQFTGQRYKGNNINNKEDKQDTLRSMKVLGTKGRHFAKSNII